MSADLEPRGDDLAQLKAAIRSHNTAEIQGILRTLKPQIDGSYGPVNPRLIEVYFKGLAEIAKLYRVYDPEVQPPDEQAPERQEKALRELAEKQLQELALRSASPGPGGD
jgi:hypothetical protein